MSWQRKDCFLFWLTIGLVVTIIVVTNSSQVAVTLLPVFMFEMRIVVSCLLFSYLTSGARLLSERRVTLLSLITFLDSWEWQKHRHSDSQTLEKWHHQEFENKHHETSITHKTIREYKNKSGITMREETSFIHFAFIFHSLDDDDLHDRDDEVDEERLRHNIINVLQYTCHVKTCTLA